jgi:metal-responsive CopG/Arc/MetJ family transcriptional regulator
MDQMEETQRLLEELKTAARQVRDELGSKLRSEADRQALIESVLEQRVQHEMSTDEGGILQVVLDICMATRDFKPNEE